MFDFSVEINYSFCVASERLTDVDQNDVKVSHLEPTVVWR
jgi:hypothetical protein